MRIFLPLLALAGLAAAAPEPIPLAPGKPVRLQVQAGAKGVIIRVEVEAGDPGGGGGPEPPPAADKLRDELAALYAKDADQKKAEHARALAELYAWAEGAVGKPAYRTAGDFRKALGEKSASLLPADVLLPVRERVRDELRAALPPKASATLDVAAREKAGALLGRLAKIMGDVAR